MVAELIDAYERNKFQADQEFKYSDNGGRLVRVTGYVSAVDHGAFKMSEGPQGEFDFSFGSNEVSCRYANDDVRLSPGLLVDEWVAVTARGEGEGTFGGIELTECHDVTAVGGEALDPTPTPQRLEISGIGSKVVEVDNAPAGFYIASITISGNEECYGTDCYESCFEVLVQDGSEYGMEYLAVDCAKEWSGETAFRVGGAFGLKSGTLFVSVESMGDWSVVFTLQ